jgi:hypothetical protein
MSSAPLQGRCVCGAIKLTLTPPTDFVSHCHCDSCRRAHAAAFVTWTSVPEVRFQVIGTPRSFESSNGVVRSFCGTCGTQVLYRAESTPDRVYVPVAVLDAIDRPPNSHVSYEERATWLGRPEALPCYRAKGKEALPW